jgi:hypothetical protein
MSDQTKSQMARDERTRYQLMYGNVIENFPSKAKMLARKRSLERLGIKLRVWDCGKNRF